MLWRDVADDLHNIVNYLDDRSIAAADRFISAAFAAFDDLAEMPGIGSPKQFRTARFQGTRSWAIPGFRKYLIYYQFTDEAVIVCAVVRGARRIRELLRKRAADQRR